MFSRIGIDNTKNQLVKKIKKLKLFNNFYSLFLILSPTIVFFFFALFIKKKITMIRKDVSTLLSELQKNIQNQKNELSQFYYQKINANFQSFQEYFSQLIEDLSTPPKYLENRIKIQLLSLIDFFALEIQLHATSSAKDQKDLQTIKEKVENFNDNYIKTMKQKYSAFIGHLDTHQQEAIIADDQYNLVIAGAGSGKTEVLTTKIAYLAQREEFKISSKRMIALAFQAEASKEMKNRLLNKFGVDAKIKTFHSLGREITNDDGEEYKIFDDTAKKIHEIFESCLAEPDFQNSIIHFMQVFSDDEPEKSESNFNNKIEYYDYLSKLKYKTLDGTEVKSNGERKIMNFFIKHTINKRDIEIKYESPAHWMAYLNSSNNIQPVHPDFFFPQYNIYLEHWALDKNGVVPDWFKGKNPTEEYLQGMDFKFNNFLISSIEIKEMSSKLQLFSQEELELFQDCYEQGDFCYRVKNNIPVLKKSKIIELFNQIGLFQPILREEEIESFLQSIEKYQHNLIKDQNYLLNEYKIDHFLPDTIPLMFFKENLNLFKLFDHYYALDIEYYHLLKDLEKEEEEEIREILSTEPEENIKIVLKREDFVNIDSEKQENLLKYYEPVYQENFTLQKKRLLISYKDKINMVNLLFKSGYFKKVALIQNSYKDLQIHDNIEALIQNQFLNCLTKKYPEKEFVIETISFQELLDKVYCKNNMDELPDNISRFITIAKNNNLSPKVIQERLRNESWSLKQVAFTILALKVYILYDEFLRLNHFIDYPDMINFAINKLKLKGEKYKGTIDYLLIDEFQDISFQRYELIHLLLELNPKAKLFCVGDDWQSIMSFTGSNLNFFLKFEEYFPNAQKIFMPINYRSNLSIVETGQEVIAKNLLKKKQIEKKTIAKNLETRQIEILASTHKEKYAIPYANQIAMECVYRIEKNIKEDGLEPSDIMVLYRGKVKKTKLILDKIEDTLKLKKIPYLLEKKEDKKGLYLMTVHASKGLQAKIVYLIDMTQGVFPSELEEQNIFASATIGERPQKEEEERRLFYVAITRAKEQFIIFTQKSNQSIFLEELKKHIEPMELLFSKTKKTNSTETSNDSLSKLDFDKIKQRYNIDNKTLLECHNIGLLQSCFKPCGNPNEKMENRLKIIQTSIKKGYNLFQIKNYLAKRKEI